MHTLKVSYRPDNYPEWVFWKEFTNKLNMIGVPGALDFGGRPTARPGFLPRLSLNKPADTYDKTNTTRLLRRGYEFQVKFEGKGSLVIDKFRLHALKIVEQSTSKT